jgi:hypothetical protein
MLLKLRVFLSLQYHKIALHVLVGSRVYLPIFLSDDGICYIKFFLMISVASLMNTIIKNVQVLSGN